MSMLVNGSPVWYVFNLAPSLLAMLDFDCFIANEL